MLDGEKVSGLRKAYQGLMLLAQLDHPAVESMYRFWVLELVLDAGFGHVAISGQPWLHARLGSEATKSALI